MTPIETLEGKIAKFHEQAPQSSAVRPPRPEPPAADRSEVMPEGSADSDLEYALLREGRGAGP